MKRDQQLKPSPLKSVTIRNHRPGDMGYITYRHGAIYAKEHGYSMLFEAMVARITADFIENYDPAAERCWIAEKNEQFLGCIMLIKDREIPERAKLRCFIVEESARGLGLGSHLVSLCIDFAREVGYKRIGLKTETSLSNARRLYTKAGFEMLRAEEPSTWGKVGYGEDWELKLQ